MLLSILMLASFYAFSPAQTTSGNLTLSIAEPPSILALEQEIPVIVTLKNDGDEKVKGQVHLNVIDRWRVVGDSTRDFQIGPGDSQEMTFLCVPGKGTYAAHYPIHATATVDTADGEKKLHTVWVVEVPSDALLASDVPARQQEVIALHASGVLSLASLNRARVSFRVGDAGDVVELPVGWTGSDPGTGTSVFRRNVHRGEQRSAIGVHPPWRTGWGVTWIEYLIQLPEITPIRLDFATAIRDHVPDREPPSDGVQFEIWAASGETDAFEQVFVRFSDAKRWEEAEVDLSKFAGQTIRLRLLTHPGPAHDTTCDQAYWADPILLAGASPQTDETDQAHRVRLFDSKKMAQQAVQGDISEQSWQLADSIGVALIPGRYGIVDSILSFATPKNTSPENVLTFEGWRIEMDGRRIGDWRSGFTYGDPRVEGDTWILPIVDGEKELRLVTRVWSGPNGWRVRFVLEGMAPNEQGQPRLTHISLGSVDHKVHRLYAGHGNVLEAPGKLRLRYDGFKLSTSFAGFDFTNGLSMVQATDIPPDAVVVDPERQLATLEAHHNVTFTLVPSTDGAFDAARRYRNIAQLSAGGGVPKLLGKMALDQWGGDYARAAEDLENAARYGLTDTVFVKHVWQRWGYDYRLPDIYPPAGDWDAFQRMVDACKRNGILFAPHDNYIDFYPDATGFSYQHIIFNPDGTPQRAWYNKGRQAQSYRWLPHAFQPWMEQNLQKIQDAVAPTSYFIDVFSAIPPVDYYDEAGRFYPKMVTIKAWGEAFDRVRELFDGAPTISEAGHDALVGHLDTAEADHQGWTPENRQWSWDVPAEDGERIPWHDMVTHGKFVLFAGGLGNRYAGAGTQEMHGYGSDDYLSMTVLGGRSPMCDGPFNRRAVMTYWLLHDICSELAKREMTQHTFLQDNIHLQAVRFGKDASVVVNRSSADWDFEGQTLPSYGFFAQAGDQIASVVRRDGVISAYAEGPGTLFVDARPPEHFGGIPIYVEILGVESLGGRRFALLSRWVIQSPVKEPGTTFVHFTNATVNPNSEQIAFQAQFAIGQEQWQDIGIYEVRAEGRLPENIPAGDYGIRFGIYQPEQRGRRLIIPGPRDRTNRRIGGTLVVTEGEDGDLSFSYEPSPPDEATERLNLTRQLVDFGPLMTNGAFRLLKDEKLLIPLPESADFEVILNLDKLQFPPIQKVEALDTNGQPIGEVEIHTQDELLHFTAEQDVFAYRLIP